MDFGIALMQCREVRSDISDALSIFRGRESFEFVVDVGEIAEIVWALEKMNEELSQLEKFILDYDKGSIGIREWSASELVNFYDNLLKTIQEHPMSKDNNRLVKNIVIWRHRAGQFAQTVCQMEDDD